MMSDDDDMLARVESRIGTVLCQKYRIEGILGAGGMATVYAGRHRNGHAVAIKMLNADLSRRKDIRARFIREGLAANAVKHPGAVAVIDDDVAEDGAAFLVMERLDGKTLERLWNESGQRLSERFVLAALRELCAILAAAHRAGIVHRDIKPENLFLTNDGTLKILDFGLAQLRDAARPKDTHTGMVFGTPAFMPPEQASGQTSQIDARTDIWAIGATAFTLLSGKMVHEGETAQHFVMLAATKPARSLRDVLPSVDKAIIGLVDRALAHDKATRWSSADEMGEAVRAVSQTLFGNPDPSLPTPDELVPSGEIAQNSGPQESALSSDEPTHVRAAAPATIPDGSGESTAPTRPQLRKPPEVTSERPLLPTANEDQTITAPTVVNVAQRRGPPPRLRPALVVIGAAGLALFAFVLVTRTSSTPSPLSASPSMPSMSAVATAPSPAILSTPPPPVETTSGPPPSVDPPARKPQVSTRPAPSARPRRDCSPPYELEANGRKRWKVDCL